MSRSGFHRKEAERAATETCPRCHGTGHGPVSRDPQTNAGVADDCSTCHGTGHLNTRSAA